MILDAEFYSQIFESQPMVKHLSGLCIEPDRIAEAVLLAPVPLEKKFEILQDLSKTYGGSEFEKYLEPLNMSIEQMRIKNGEVLLLYATVNDEDRDLIVPCVDMTDALKQADEFTREAQLSFQIDRSCVSYSAEKWRSDGKSFKEQITYEIMDGMVCGFWSDDPEYEKTHLWFPMFNGYEDLNLPTPFKLGDIVLLDCLPYKYPKNVVILDCGDDPYECCLPCALYYDYKDKTWKTGAVKHKNVFGGGSRPPLSPLYRIDYADPLLCHSSDEEKEIMRAVSKYINGSEEKARELFEYIFNFGSEGKNRSGYGAITEELKDYLNVKR